MDPITLEYGAATDVGRVREINEDSFLATAGLFLVADGMGGHSGGDVASRIVAEEFARLAGGFAQPRDVVGATAAFGQTLRDSQQRIAAYVATKRQAHESATWYSGTTAVIATVVSTDPEPSWLLANLGDSRAYTVRGGVFSQVTVDHSVVQELIDSGQITSAEVATHPDRHIITRALGGPEDPEADFFAVAIGPGDRLLLCSDGVTGMLDDATIALILAGEADPQVAAERIVAAAVAAGGHDNATAVVVNVVGLGHRDSQGSGHQQVNLEEKLGALS